MTDPLMEGLDSFVSEAHRQNKKAAVMLPRIFRSYIRKNTEEYLESCLHSGSIFEMGGERTCYLFRKPVRDGMCPSTGEIEWNL